MAVMESVVWMAVGIVEGILASIVVVSYANSKANKERREAEEHKRAGYIRQGRDLEAARQKLDMEHLKGRVASLETENDELRKQMCFETEFVHKLVTEGRVVAKSGAGVVAK